MEALGEFEAIERMALAMVVGAILGIERERLDRPAGMRTYMLVTEGACLFMICAILLSGQIVAAGGFSDPGRIASTVVQGIGFIAAGVILTTGKEVIGLTTAAGLWVATALGLLIGAGFYLIAIVAAVATLVALVALGHFEFRFLGSKSNPNRGAGGSPESDLQDD
jgi:putative Mg2+ transporter-C (MgtC) family protein